MKFDKDPSLDALDDSYETILELISVLDSEKVSIISKKLTALTRAELDAYCSDAMLKKQRLASWLIHREYTRRDIPPVFRKLPYAEEDNFELIADLLWYDLEWIHANLEGHKPFFRRWAAIFMGKEFPHKTAKYILSELKPEIWKTLKGLSLDDKYQLEMHFLKKDSHKNSIERLNRLKPIVLDLLRTAHYEKGLKLLEEKDKATIQRRLDIWYCGCLANKSPQKTANYYEAMTNNKINRSLAGKIIEQVKKDAPKVFQKKWVSSV